MPDALRSPPITSPPHPEQVIAAPETAGSWDLFLVDWGYNTPAERAAAAANPAVELVGVERFTQLLAGR